MKCLNCDNEAKGRSKYCSDSCKVLYNRKQRKGITVNNENRKQPTVTPKYTGPTMLDPSLRPANFGQPDCECKHCQSKRINKSKNIINHGAWKSADQLGKNEINRVSLPGDVDYVPQNPCLPLYRALYGEDFPNNGGSLPKGIQ